MSTLGKTYDDRIKELEATVEGLSAEIAHIMATMGNDHYVTFNADGFTIEHPFSERLAGTMATCQIIHSVRDMDMQYNTSHWGRWKLVWDSVAQDWILETP